MKAAFKDSLLFVDPQGFEPRQTAPKTGVLPLHHGSKTCAKIRTIFIPAKII